MSNGHHGQQHTAPQVPVDMSPLAPVVHLGRHLVLAHGWPAGLLEVGNYDLGELEWEHRALHDALRDTDVCRPAGRERHRDPSLPPAADAHTHSAPLALGTPYGSRTAP